MNAVKRKATRARRLGTSARRLAEMIEEATVDAYDESEQATGWFTMLENYLELPFETEMLGVLVTVVGIEQCHGHQIAAVCKRGKKKLAVAIVDVPLPSPRPEGAEWIEAYRYWLGDR